MADRSVFGRSFGALFQDDTTGGRSPGPLLRVASEDPFPRPQIAAERGGKQRVVIISGYHDYRTRKRASIHQIADGLVTAGFDVAFISTRFSLLSKLTGDSRLILRDNANTMELCNGVKCLLWRTLVHPFSSQVSLVQSLTGYAYGFYSELPNRDFDQLVREADYVLVESGAAAVYLRRIRRLNSRAKIIYYAADRLETINAHPFIRGRLAEDQPLIDHFSLRATQLKADFPYATGRMYKAGFGINESEFAAIGPSPYSPDEKVAVSVGSMLFDPSVFELAAATFPELQFHVIGAGADFDAPPNVHIHPEMPFERTLPFVKHASIGIAAYAPVAGAEYLAESSLKLAQFEYFGLPSICPDFAVGSSPSRIGYEPGDEASIKSAISRALSMVGQVESRSFDSWERVALQVIEPERYAATLLG